MGVDLASCQPLQVREAGERRFASLAEAWWGGVGREYFLSLCIPGRRNLAEGIWTELDATSA